MRRVQIEIRRPDGAEHRMRLNRFGSAVATTVLAALAIVVLVLAVAFGYVVLGIVLAVLLIAIVAAILRSAWSAIRR